MYPWRSKLPCNQSHDDDNTKLTVVTAAMLAKLLVMEMAISGGGLHLGRFLTEITLGSQLRKLYFYLMISEKVLFFFCPKVKLAALPEFVRSSIQPPVFLAINSRSASLDRVSMLVRN